MGIKDKMTALLWGLAEATLFFIIPDVHLSRVAMKTSEWKTAINICLFALVGAILGGCFIYLWSYHNMLEVQSVFVTYIPAIHELMINDVGVLLNKFGLWGVILGPTQGMPYKIFASYAPEYGWNLMVFVLISIPARLLRFIIINLIAFWISNKLLNKWTWKQKSILHVSIWMFFYIIYWAKYW